MSKLDEMIRELCPDGVEYVKLNSVCDIYDGTHSTPNYTESGVKFASVENIGNLYATRKYIFEKDFEKYKIKPRIGDVMMTRIGSVGVCTVVDRNEALAFYVSLALLRPQLDKVQSRFLKYAIESIHGRKELRKRTLINAVPIKINKDDIGKVTIPLPPIEIQSEIVHTLDNYTENVVKLQNQLTAELTARKTQYTYYRDKLLTHNYNGKIKRLEECCDSIADGDHQAPPKADSGIPFITISDIDERHEINFNVIKYVPDEYYNRLADKRRPQKGDVLYTVVGSYGIPVYVKENKKFVFQRHIAILRPNNAVVDSRYLYHAMNGTAFHRQADLAAKGAAQKTIGLASLAKMTVPVPPLDVQNRIVNVLDNFEKICSDLNIGLPAEIEARQKQYEYYRDKLLTFAETGNTILNGTERNGTER